MHSAFQDRSRICLVAFNWAQMSYEFPFSPIAMRGRGCIVCAMLLQYNCGKELVDRGLSAMESLTTKHAKHTKGEDHDDEHRAQVQNYLRAAKLRLGLPD